jgi:ubiquinone/menaquinone biosynthesis C-methylase UbiE
MVWYDWFSSFYDRSLEPLYREQRLAAAVALQSRPGQTILDLPCGTGQSFDGLAPAVGPEGLVIGVDYSAGMLRQAGERVRRRGFTRVVLHRSDVHALDPAALAAAAGRPVQIDRLHVFLGLSAFPRWEAAFERLWALLAPGGRCVVVDVHAERLGVQGRMVNLVARADIRREFWRPLERLAADYERVPLPSLPQHGGQLHLASGRKPT